MEHCTPEQLALAALREPLPADDTAHLEACAECRRRSRACAAGGAARRPRVRGPGCTVPPPPRSGRRSPRPPVTAAPRPERVAADPAPAPEPTAPPTTSSPSARAGRAPGCSSRRLPWSVRPSEPAPSRSSRGTTTTARRLPPRRWTRWRTPTPPARPGWSSARTAPACSRSTSGHRARRRLLRGLAARARRLRPRAAGHHPGGHHVFEIPAGLDLESSPVDVSVEPLDGDPAHSGDSIVRGCWRAERVPLA